MPESQESAFSKDALNKVLNQYKQSEPATQPALTFGQKLVGLNFNPSNDDKVGKAKQLCADLMDLVNSERAERPRETTELESLLYQHTVGEILNAQMNVVKLLTLKY